MTRNQSTRSEIVALGRALYDRGITHGRTGNLSVRVGDRLLMTPTGMSLGRLSPDHLSVLDLAGTHISGDHPSKELELHRVYYERHSEVRAVAHVHSTHAVALSCLAGLDEHQPLAPLTAYYVMRVGTMPLIGYFPPGDPQLAQALRTAAPGARCALLANHGTIAAAGSLEAAVDAVEEIEETARLTLLLHGRRLSPLSNEQVRALTARAAGPGHGASPREDR